MGLEPASVRPCVRPSVRASTLSNMNISETSRPITTKFIRPDMTEKLLTGTLSLNTTNQPTKFYLKHHWGGGKAALGFDADQIRTLVSMATDSSHRVIMGKGRHHVFLTVFDRILFILAGNDDIHKSLHEFEIRPDPTTDNRVSCP